MRGNTQYPPPVKTNTPLHTGSETPPHRQSPPPPTYAYPTTPGAPHMPHTPATHITVTPKHVYINGEPARVERDSLELSVPSSTDVQTVTLTITPTTVTILNDDNPDTINAAREAVTHSTRDEADSIRSTYILPSGIEDMLATRKR